MCLLSFFKILLTRRATSGNRQEGQEGPRGGQGWGQGARGGQGGQGARGPSSNAGGPWPLWPPAGYGPVCTLRLTIWNSLCFAIVMSVVKARSETPREYLILATSMEIGKLTRFSRKSDGIPPRHVKILRESR